MAQKKLISSHNLPYIYIARNGDGFSLIEMLVAIAISSVILLMLYTSYHSVISATSELSKVANFYEQINLAIHHIDRDISNAYVNRQNKDIFFIGENQTSSPFKGKLNFVTINHRNFVINSDPGKEIRSSDVHEVGYYLKSYRDKPDEFMLIKREQNTYDDEPETGGNESVILDHVIDLKFEFRLRNTWVDSWDSRKYIKFPHAVKTILKVKNYRGEEEDFIFISYLYMSK
ncbi:MAG: prepilin-type N-terminal cleavage/methylation domain-containing protein [Spirochaetes bacterium]|nr:prepilin-type N-terminal cleavage/methylation domain-containing protein [Spirochaetota bacterium]